MKTSIANPPCTLSNEDLVAATRALVSRSNAALADLIAHLAEVDTRKIYLEQARPSMFAWCVAELGCSEDVACNWIAVARASREYPAVLDVLREGKVHLTGLRMLAPHLTAEGHRALLDEAAGKSKRELEEIIARIAPKPPVPETIRKLPSGGRAALVETTTLAAKARDAACASEALEGQALSSEATRFNDHRHSNVTERSAKPVLAAPMATPMPSRPVGAGRVEPLSAESYKVTFTASRRLKDKIQQARDLLAHGVPGGEIAEIIEQGLDMLIADARKKRFGVGRKPRAAKMAAPNARTLVDREATDIETQRKEVKARDAGGLQRRRNTPGEARQHGRDPAAGEALDGGNVRVRGEAMACGLQRADRMAPNSRTSRKEVKPRDCGKQVTGRGSRAEEASSRDERTASVDVVFTRSRYIPAEIRRAVLERDGERCAFVDDDGRRCEERSRLELDHIEGFARGGRHTVDAIRVLCRSHNKWAAERMYGRAFMDEKRTQGLDVRSGEPCDKVTRADEAQGQVAKPAAARVTPVCAGGIS